MSETTGEYPNPRPLATRDRVTMERGEKKRARSRQWWGAPRIFTSITPAALFFVYTKVTQKRRPSTRCAERHLLYRGERIRPLQPLVAGLLLRGKQQDRLCRLPISSAPTAFLEKRLRGFRNIGVDDRANVTFVHAHAVRAGRRKHGVGPFKELPFDLFFPLSGEAGVVKQCCAVGTLPPEHARNHFRFRPSATENECGPLHVFAGMPDREGRGRRGRF